MDESGLDHMFSSASFHEVAYSSNPHATSLPNGVENICSAIEDIPTACQVPEGASLAGNSSSTLNMMTSADEANFIQPHISLQGQRFNESYANQTPTDYLQTSASHGDSTQNSDFYQDPNDLPTMGEGHALYYQMSGLHTPAAFLGGGAGGQWQSRPVATQPMLDPSLDMSNFLGPLKSSTLKKRNQTPRRTKHQKRGTPRSGISTDANPIKTHKKQGGIAHPSVYLALLEESLRDHSKYSPYFRQISLPTATLLRPVKRLIDDEFLHVFDVQPVNMSPTANNSSSQDSLSIPDVTDSGYRTEDTSLSSTPRQQDYDDVDCMSLDAQSMQPTTSKSENDTVYPCSVTECSKSFKDYSNWKRHEETHWPRIRFMCLDCISTQVDLNGHWACDFCQVSFSPLFTPGQHYLQCTSAQEQAVTFARKYHLNKHLRDQHGMETTAANQRCTEWHYLIPSDWPRVCEPCGVNFVTWEERAKHIAANHYKRGDYGPQGFYPKPKYDDSDDEDDSDDNNRPTPKRAAEYGNTSGTKYQSQSLDESPDIGASYGSWSQYTYSINATADPSSSSHKRFRQDAIPKPQITRKISAPLERYLNDNEDTTAGLLSARTFNGADVLDCDFSSPQAQLYSDGKDISSCSSAKVGFTETEQIATGSDAENSNRLGLKRPTTATQVDGRLIGCHLDLKSGNSPWWVLEEKCFNETLLFNRRFAHAMSQSTTIFLSQYFLVTPFLESVRWPKWDVGAVYIEYITWLIGTEKLASSIQANKYSSSDALAVAAMVHAELDHFGRHLKTGSNKIPLNLKGPLADWVSSIDIILEDRLREWCEIFASWQGQFLPKLHGRSKYSKRKSNETARRLLREIKESDKSARSAYQSPQAFGAPLEHYLSPLLLNQQIKYAMRMLSREGIVEALKGMKRNTRWRTKKTWLEDGEAHKIPRQTSELDVEVYNQRRDKFGRAISEHFDSVIPRSQKNILITELEDTMRYPSSLAFDTSKEVRILTLLSAEKANESRSSFSVRPLELHDRPESFRGKATGESEDQTQASEWHIDSNGIFSSPSDTESQAPRYHGKKSKADNKEFPKISKPVEHFRNSYDCFVIGSGPSIGLASSQIAKAREEISILEKGQEWWPRDYTTNTMSQFTPPELPDDPWAHHGPYRVPRFSPGLIAFAPSPGPIVDHGSRSRKSYYGKERPELQQGTMTLDSGTPITGRVHRAKKEISVHSCKMCKPVKTFTRVEHLRRHQLSHEMPVYRCTFEEFTRRFQRPDLLTGHMHQHEIQTEMHYKPGGSLALGESKPQLGTARLVDDISFSKFPWKINLDANMSEVLPDPEHDLHPSRTRKRRPSSTPRAKRSRVDKGDSTIKSQSQEVSQVRPLQNLFLTCIFEFAGCKSDFANVNEWKRQVFAQLLNLNTWTCKRQLYGKTSLIGGGNGGSFNRKELVMQHLKRSNTYQADQGLFSCKYSECRRARNPFTRKDHYRDHLRHFHKEATSMFRPQKKSVMSKKRYLSERRMSPQWWNLPLGPERIPNETQLSYLHYLDTDMPYQMGQFLVVEDDSFDMLLGHTSLLWQYAYPPISNSRNTIPDSKDTQDNYNNLEIIAAPLSQSQANHNSRHRRGPWSKTENFYLAQLVLQGALNWVRIAQLIGSRSPKQCRERYHQYLKLLFKHEPIRHENRAATMIEEFDRPIDNELNTLLQRFRSENTVKNTNKSRRRRLLLKSSNTSNEQYDPQALSSTTPFDSHAPCSLAIAMAQAWDSSG